MDAGSVGSIITSVVLVAIIVIIVGLLISCVKIVPAGAGSCCGETGSISGDMGSWLAF